jgi:hypothetical protein
MEIKESLWMFIMWGTPIGLGFFLAGLGIYTYFAQKAAEIKQRMENQNNK